MKSRNRFLEDIMDIDAPEAAQDVVLRAGHPTAAEATADGDIILSVPFRSCRKGDFLEGDAKGEKTWSVRIRAYGDTVVRVTAAFDQPPPGDDSVMLDLSPAMARQRLVAEPRPGGWRLVDAQGRTRMELNSERPAIQPWSNLVGPPPYLFAGTVFPDGATAVPFLPYDSFFPGHHESVSLGCIVRDGKPQRTCFSVHAEPNEKFAGTGERFARMNLAGQTLELENTDGLGVNSRRAYKNIPFFVSSRLYGLLVLTSASVRLSLAGVSTRAAQGMVEDPTLDLFFIGGGSLEQIVCNYRRLTGFPSELPLWSYGIWMSRMTYFSAEETNAIVKRLRDEEFPCDVIHLDTGWFKTDWKCEWEFSRERFPDPEGYMRALRRSGIRTSLWQMPKVSKDTPLFETARIHRYIPPKSAASGGTGSDFGAGEYAGDLDFSNPATVVWYKGLLANVLKMGASVIKTDFGEDIDLNADYAGLPARLLHNLYALLYQKAAFEITKATTGDGIIWARAGWTGCQRYPLHWGGDAACSWDGMAGTIRGGLHLGLSGFAFWSHDVPGFHGVPDFMNNRPPDDLYVRWTQLGVFTSHMRYHGTSAREPYEYPDIADLVRTWWRLRYCLIPYLVDQSRACVASGLPIFRALAFHHASDPLCWEIDDQYYCGDAFLVAPILNSEGQRDVYLPEGRWIDFWTGEEIQGPTCLRGVVSPLDRMPVYAVAGSRIRVCVDPVQCTDEMDLGRSGYLAFDSSYQGLAASVLGPVVGL